MVNIPVMCNYMLERPTMAWPNRHRLFSLWRVPWKTAPGVGRYSWKTNLQITNGLEPQFWNWTGRQKGIPKGVDETHQRNRKALTVIVILHKGFMSDDMFFNEDPLCQHVIVKHYHYLTNCLNSFPFGTTGKMQMPCFHCIFVKLNQFLQCHLGSVLHSIP